MTNACGSFILCDAVDSSQVNVVEWQAAVLRMMQVMTKTGGGRVNDSMNWRRLLGQSDRILQKD